MPSITLLSDFGLQDATVAVAKAILMQYAPGLPIIDISHEVQPFYAPQAAYLLAGGHKNFPPGTCHIILFDLFAQKPTRVLLSAYNGHYFLSPDNGIVPMALPAANVTSWLYSETEGHEGFTHWLASAGQAASRLQHAEPAAMALHAYLPKALPQSKPQLSTGGFVACEAMHIDNYENVVLNITRQQFDNLGEGKAFRLRFMEVEEIDALSTSYADVREGYKMCRFNSSGYLEICVNRGKAASLFGLRIGSRHNNIKLFFE